MAFFMILFMFLRFLMTVFWIVRDLEMCRWPLNFDLFAMLKGFTSPCQFKWKSTPPHKIVLFLILLSDKNFHISRKIIVLWIILAFQWKQNRKQENTWKSFYFIEQLYCCSSCFSVITLLTGESFSSSNGYCLVV